MDREARQATVHGVAKSQTRVSDQHFTSNHSASEDTGLVHLILPNHQQCVSQ